MKHFILVKEISGIVQVGGSIFGEWIFFWPPEITVKISHSIHFYKKPVDCPVAVLEMLPVCDMCWVYAIGGFWEIFLIFFPISHELYFTILLFLFSLVWS